MGRRGRSGWQFFGDRSLRQRAMSAGRLQIAKCKLQIENLGSTICNLQFAICILQFFRHSHRHHSTFWICSRMSNAKLSAVAVNSESTRSLNELVDSRNNVKVVMRMMAPKRAELMYRCRLKLGRLLRRGDCASFLSFIRSQRTGQGSKGELPQAVAQDLLQIP